MISPNCRIGIWTMRICDNAYVTHSLQTIRSSYSTHSIQEGKKNCRIACGCGLAFWCRLLLYLVRNWMIFDTNSSISFSFVIVWGLSNRNHFFRIFEEKKKKVFLRSIYLFYFIFVLHSCAGWYIQYLLGLDTVTKCLSLSICVCAMSEREKRKIKNKKRKHAHTAHTHDRQFTWDRWFFVFFFYIYILLLFNSLLVRHVVRRPNVWHTHR